MTGQGLAREQDALARAGFVVLHTDYRGHATSDPVAAARARDPARLHPRLRQRGQGARDAAVRRRRPDRHARPVDGRRRDDERARRRTRAWSTRPSPGRASARTSSRTSGTSPSPAGPTRRSDSTTGWARPARRPDVYAELSARTYFDRITEPVLVHHAHDRRDLPVPVGARHRAADGARRRRQHGCSSTRARPRVRAAVAGSMDRTVRFLRDISASDRPHTPVLR